MLDIIRKKASAWVTKIIFAVIIIVFIFFFGYSRMASRVRGASGGVVASVNGHNITGPEFQLAYDNTYQMYKNIFKTPDGALPEGVEKSITSSALNQLIQQAVVKNFGKKLGMTPTDEEIAKIIQKSPVATDETGKFDEFMYKKRFLPYFSQKYGIDYEYLVAGDVLLSNVKNVFGSAAKAPFARENYNQDNTKWTFSITEFDNEQDAKNGKNGKEKKVGPVSIAERSQVFPSTADISVWQKVFTFDSNNPSLKEPVNAEGKWYKVKIAKIDLSSNDQWNKDRESFVKNSEINNERNMFQLWVSTLLKKAKIKTFIKE